MLKIAAKTKEVKNCSGSNAILWSGQVSAFNQSYRFGRLNIYPFSSPPTKPTKEIHIETQIKSYHTKEWSKLKHKYIFRCDS